MSANVINHLFTNNTPPLPPEVKYIRNEIDSLMKAIDKLQSQLNKLQGRTRNYRVLLSPLRRIPPEILGEIFVLTPRYAYSSTRSHGLILELGSETCFSTFASYVNRGRKQPWELPRSGASWNFLWPLRHWYTRELFPGSVERELSPKLSLSVGRRPGTAVVPRDARLLSHCWRSF